MSIKFYKYSKELGLWDDKISIHTCIDATVRYLKQEKIYEYLQMLFRYL